MMSPEYSTYFSTMAAVGATLFGLIFVAISIVPESDAQRMTPLERQAKATTSYLALLNPLVISLFALIPHQQVGYVAIGMSTLGLLNTLGMTLTLFRSTGPSFQRFRHSLFVLAGFFLYGYQGYFAIHLIKSPTDNVSLFFLANILIMSSIFGVIRAWELIGMRQLYLLAWLASIRKTGKAGIQKNQESSQEPSKNS